MALLLGGGVRGGRVWGPWKGLSEQHLLEGRDVPSLTDIRVLLAEALSLHGGRSSPEAVFPGLGASPPARSLGWLNIRC
ncbi:hypothetical protein [Stigmatella aurantiaca]|uniref:Uncharacterized protein n=1 Tax=Stigmatella aurantiaca (strain DW4/3-1) TaxID=378806 RepID=Q08VQ6_STIAD|nr:hypothetical protein STIAU_8135 [Stigmatella aurantiaca DW4/3-1]